MKLEPLLTLSIEVGEPISAGAARGAEVRVIALSEGSFSGPGLRGRLLPGGSDWQRVRPDGVVEIRAHYLLETDAGERIEVISEGLRHAGPGVLERIALGEEVPPEEYYFRTSVRLHTAAPRLEHLNRQLYVSSGERTRDAVHLTLFVVP